MLDRRAVRGARDDRRARGRREREEAVPRGLDERAAREVDVEQELGVVLARERPEARAGAAGGDDDVEAGDLALREGEGRERVVAQR